MTHRDHRFKVFIFIPTRDRPETLVKTIKSIIDDQKCNADKVELSIVVIDDSQTIEARERNKAIVLTLGQAILRYHGRAEQRRLLESLQHNDKRISALFPLFFRRLGGASWDLGGVRNYTLLLTLLIAGKHDVIVFMDDDIELVTHDRSKYGVITNLCRRVAQDRRLIVGGILLGAPDVSAVERTVINIRRKCGLINFKPPRRPISASGGLISFARSLGTRVPFPRTYNEDWIWLLVCSAQGAMVIRSTTKGKHLIGKKSNTVCQSQLRREQFGEILCTGINFSLCRHGHLISAIKQMQQEEFWRDIRYREVRYLEKLRDALVREAKGLTCDPLSISQRVEYEVLQEAHRVTSKTSVRALIKEVAQYSELLLVWHRIVQDCQHLKLDHRLF